MTATLQGFTTLVRDQVQVVVGRNVDLPLSLKLASVAETITVTGESPLVDTRATGTATNFTSEELTKIPTSRDPFALMRAVPGVLVDRVNIGGNETGQQSNFVSKGTRPQDAVWTLDGVNITDMAATGASPTYFNYDNFEEVQVATAGQSIKQPTGGIGLNMIVKRGTNRFSGGARGYFTNDSLESSNVPDELSASGVTADTTDHNDQISDYGYDIGGPIFRNRAWFYHSYSIQDVRLVRRAGALVDRTILKNPNVKVNWQATSKDMVSFLYFDGFKVKDGRSSRDLGHSLRRTDGHLPPGQRVRRQPAPRPVEDRQRPDDRIADVLVSKVCLLQHRLHPRPDGRDGHAGWTKSPGGAVLRLRQPAA